VTMRSSTASFICHSAKCRRWSPFSTSRADVTTLA
jgi:hypothetical protein